LFQVNVAIADLDADKFESGQMEDISVWRRSFPAIDFLTRASLWHPLTTYIAAPAVEYRRFNVEIFSRNGGFFELLRVKRLKGGGWATAILVSASYFNNKRGIVLEKIGNSFPRELLSVDKDWVNMKKLKVIKVAQ